LGRALKELPAGIVFVMELEEGIPSEIGVEQKFFSHFPPFVGCKVKEVPGMADPEQRKGAQA